MIEREYVMCKELVDDLTDAGYRVVTRKEWYEAQARIAFFTKKVEGVSNDTLDKFETVFVAAKTLCDGWTDDERRYLHILTEAAEINELRKAVAELEPRPLELSI